MQFSINCLVSTLSLAHVSFFGMLKQYLQPGYDPTAQNANTCNVSLGLKILLRSVFDLILPMTDIQSVYQ